MALTDSHFSSHKNTHGKSTHDMVAEPRFPSIATCIEMPFASQSRLASVMSSLTASAWSGTVRRRRYTMLSWMQQRPARAATGFMDPRSAWTRRDLDRLEYERKSTRSS